VALLPGFQVRGLFGGIRRGAFGLDAIRSSLVLVRRNLVSLSTRLVRVREGLIDL
jgi:hypothetical protein